jgi:hypothetical protein
LLNGEPVDLPQPPLGRILIDLHGHRAAGHRPAVRRPWRPTTHADTAWVGRLVEIEITEDSR